MLPFSAIAFDLDNTLIDRDAAFLRLLTRWFPLANHNEALQIDDQGHGSREELFQYLSDGSSDAETLWQKFCREFPSFFVPDRPTNNFLTRITVPRAILTNGNSTLQRAKLKQTGLDKVFQADAIVISEEIGCAKPDRRAFQRLAETLQSRPDEILYVGDHFANDIQGAHTAGFQTCWITPEAPVNAPQEADILIRTPVELEKICPGII
ncbi:MAG: HAD family hydrolase [Verrucomicrobiales bacterium]|nr:HAD family hydrolase [Verrucomicrobiales bacterium]